VLRWHDIGIEPNRCFDEEMGLIGSKTVKKKLFLDHTVPAAAVERITGGSLCWSKITKSCHEKSK
jgi:hypothetical protein